MAEPPDFEQIAERLSGKLSDEMDPDNAREFVAELVQAVWNASGHADADAAVTRLSTLVGWVSSEPYLNHIREAIAALDR